MDELASVRIPADVEKEDRILAGLTARQVVILGVTGLLLWLVYTGTARWVPLPVFAALACPVGALATVVTLGRRDGLPLYRLLLAGVRQKRSPRTMVIAPDGVAPLPSWVDGGQEKPLAPLRLPANAVAADGVIDLGAEGTALICAASTVSFALRTPAEQASLVGVFARWLNSLAGSAQVVVRADEVDVAPLIRRYRERAGDLPRLALEEAALEHADFLAELTGQRDLLRRQVLIVLREPRGGGPRLFRRADEAARTLAGAGISVRPLSGGEAVQALATDPWGPPRSPAVAPAETVIKGTPK